MNYAILKLHFLAPVHFGTASGHLFDNQMTCLDDTFFSALFLEALAESEETADKLYQACKCGQLLISDLMPYRGETYFLPKPLLSAAKRELEHSSVQKKQFKNLQYLSAEHFQDYLTYLKGEKDFSAKAERELLQGICKNESRVSAHINGMEKTDPYEVQCVRFNENCGLYAIVAYESAAELNMVNELCALLGYSGLGGKRSSGMGSFKTSLLKLTDCAGSLSIKALAELLDYDKADYQMLIAAALPTEDGLEKALDSAYYKVIKRSGFIDGRYADNLLKKKDLYVLQSGSCFKKRFDGDIYDVSRENMHPVYRYAKGMFVGVKV